MEVIPAIDVRNGRCVRLLQGDYTRETVFGDDPVAVALHWEALGALRLHVVDLEGARVGAPVEAETIERIIKGVSIPVQVGGGVRSLQQAHRYLLAGADRVVFGTAAVKERSVVIEALAMDPGAVVVALDARDGRIQLEGWLDAAVMSVGELARDMEQLGVRRVLATDISRDGMLSEPNFEGLAGLQATTSMAVIASGGVATVSHVERLAGLGLEAVIIGRALYTGDIELQDALNAAVGGDSMPPDRSGPAAV